MASQGLPDPSVQQAGPSTPGPNPPSMLGDQNQQPQQSQQQGDPTDQLKTQLAQRIQQLTPPPPSGGPVKQYLQNWFHNFSNASAVHLGLPTPQMQQNQLLTQYSNLNTSDALNKLRGSMAQQYGMVPVSLPDGTQIQLPANSAKTVIAAQARNQANMSTFTPESAVAIGHPEFAGQSVPKGIMDMLAKTSVANINQGGGLQLPVSEVTANLAGAPELAGKNLGKGGWQMLNTALRTRGFHVQDMGTSGGDGGLWVVDNAGNKIHQVSPTSLMMARGQGYALGRAEYTPFETVQPGTNIPTTISNLQALQTGAPKVPLGTQQKLGGQYALYHDAYGILDNIDRLTDKVNLDAPGVSSRVTAGYAALKDPAAQGLTGQVLSNLLARQPINNQLTPDERELVLNMAQGKAAATGLRSILGQAGTNEMQQRLDSGLMPGGQTAGSKASMKQQTAATRALLGRFQVGLPQAGLNAPGTPTALSNQNKIPVVELSTGRSGTIPENEFDPAKYRKR